MLSQVRLQFVGAGETDGAKQAVRRVLDIPALVGFMGVREHVPRQGAYRVPERFVDIPRHGDQVGAALGVGDVVPPLPVEDGEHLPHVRLRDTAEVGAGQGAFHDGGAFERFAGQHRHPVLRAGAESDDSARFGDDPELRGETQDVSGTVTTRPVGHEQR